MARSAGRTDHISELERRPDMSLWQVILACVLAWISGAFFSACIRDGFLISARERDEDSPFAAHAYPLGPMRWLQSPAVLLQLGLLAAFLVATIILIVVNL